MAAKVTPEDVVRAQAHVVGLLNEAEAVLTGWVLGYERNDVEKLTRKLYEMTDTDTPPSVRRQAQA